MGVIEIIRMGLTATECKEDFILILVIVNEFKAN